MVVNQKNFITNQKRVLDCIMFSQKKWGIKLMKGHYSYSYFSLNNEKYEYYTSKIFKIWILQWIWFTNGQISKVAVFVSMIVDVVWVLREPDIQHAEGTNDRAAEKLPPVTGTHPFHLSLWADILLDEQMLPIPQANAIEQTLREWTISMILDWSQINSNGHLIA